VYDVLNVLSAVQMISKDGKTIQWVTDQLSDVPQDQAQLEVCMALGFLWYTFIANGVAGAPIYPDKI